MTNETFSDRLKLAMQAKQFKQVDLIRAAQRRGVKLGKSHVSQYVSGKTVPRSDILHFLADVLQVDPDWLLAKDSTVNYTADTVSDPAESFSDPSAASLSQTKTGGSPMREFKKSSKLDNVLYDVRGPVVEEANRMEACAGRQAGVQPVDARGSRKHRSSDDPPDGDCGADRGRRRSDGRKSRFRCNLPLQGCSALYRCLPECAVHLR